MEPSGQLQHYHLMEPSGQLQHLSPEPMQQLGWLMVTSPCLKPNSHVAKLHFWRVRCGRFSAQPHATPVELGWLCRWWMVSPQLGFFGCDKAWIPEIPRFLLGNALPKRVLLQAGAPMMVCALALRCVLPEPSEALLLSTPSLGAIRARKFRQKQAAQTHPLLFDVHVPPELLGCHQDIHTHRTFENCGCCYLPK